MTDRTGREERRMCGARAVMPLGLVSLVLDAMPGARDPLEMETLLRCPLEEHTTGWHYDVVWQLDDPDSGDMWALWADGDAPDLVVIQPDCSARCRTSVPNTTREAGRSGGESEVCALFALHPGGHSFEFTDPQYADLRLAAACNELRAVIARQSRSSDDDHEAGPTCRPPVERSARPDGTRE
ncbi:hypothetical protein ABZ348_23140 [Streptomyces sp. NPDC005963]|uniref:hypothetical protein n=1 Tax=Streptomyces sp. NPDC005963 TaxID=3156721 RepID=UPI0033DD0CEC